jgi:hypothetical protein
MNKSAKEILNESNSFFRTNFPCWTKRTGHYAWPHCSFALAIILLVIEHGALQVLVVALRVRTIVVLIVLMMIVESVIIAVAWVASMIVAIFTTTMLAVA